MIPFWRRTVATQYVRMKPNPCGLENFVSAAQDGLPLDFFSYEGKGDKILEENWKLGVAEKVVIRLVQTLLSGSGLT